MKYINPKQSCRCDRLDKSVVETKGDRIMAKKGILHGFLSLHSYLHELPVFNAEESQRVMTMIELVTGLERNSGRRLQSSYTPFLLRYLEPSSSRRRRCGHQRDFLIPALTTLEEPSPELCSPQSPVPRTMYAETV